MTAAAPDRADRRKVTGDVVEGAGRPLAKRKSTSLPRAGTGRRRHVDSTESDDRGSLRLRRVRSRAARAES